MSSGPTLRELGFRPVDPKSTKTQLPPAFEGSQSAELWNSNASYDPTTNFDLPHSPKSARRPFRSSPLAGPALSGESSSQPSRECSPRRIPSGLSPRPSTSLKEPPPCYARPKSSTNYSSQIPPRPAVRPRYYVSPRSDMPASLSLSSINAKSEFLPSPPPSPLFDDFGAQRMPQVSSLTRSGQDEFLTVPEVQYRSRRLSPQNPPSDQLRHGARMTMDTRMKYSRPNVRGQSSNLSLSTSSLPTRKPNYILKQPTTPTVRVTPALPINDSWYTHHAFAITPPFTRLGLRSPDVVLPVSAKEYRRKSAATQRGRPSTLANNSLRSTSATSVGSSFSWNQSNGDSFSTLASSPSTDPPAFLAHRYSKADTGSSVYTDDTCAIPDDFSASTDWVKVVDNPPIPHSVVNYVGSVRTCSDTASSTDTLYISSSPRSDSASSVSSLETASAHRPSPPLSPKNDEAPVSRQDPRDASLYSNVHAHAHIRCVAQDPPPKRKSMLARVKSWNWGFPSNSPNAHERAASSHQTPPSASSLPAAVASKPHLPLDGRHAALGQDRGSTRTSPADTAEAAGARPIREHVLDAANEAGSDVDKCSLSVNGSEGHMAYLNVKIVDAVANSAKCRSWSIMLRRGSMKRAWKTLRTGGAGVVAGSSSAALSAA